MKKSEIKGQLSLFDFNKEVVPVLHEKEIQLEHRPKLLIIDGSSMVSTNYYATLPRSILYAKTQEEQESHYKEIMHASNGVYTNAIFTSLRMLVSLWSSYGFTHIAVCFDQTRNTFRKRMYENYKGNRKPSPSPLKEQMIRMETILKEIGIPVFYSTEYEADDYAGTLCRMFQKEAQVVVLTKDHDYYQLASDSVRLWMMQSSQEHADALFQKYGLDAFLFRLPPKVFEFTKDTVKEETGVYPEQIPDLKAIMGDSSDNIPGCKGVSSAAAPLIAEYGSVEELYQYLECCASPKEEKKLAAFWKNQMGISRSPMKALKEHKETVLLSKVLATIQMDIPLNVVLSDLQIQVNQKRLQEICRELDIRKL